MQGPFVLPVIAVFIAFAMLLEFRLRSPPHPSIFCVEVASGHMMIEKVRAASRVSSCPCSISLIKFIAGESSSSESDILFIPEGV